ncbi:MAG: o-succinylbenzoate synthase, partial [Cruoricaptor ignavus]|nr:o-succinylbenzoate synthase [Cruoricaptor ignavus]
INEDYSFLKEKLLHFPSIWFGYEQAILNLKYGNDIYFPSEFTNGKDSIKINGLIWMGTPDFMQQQIEEKLHLGFDCIKLKIGVDWDSEKEILKQLRQLFPKEKLELRVDANGAFDYNKAKTVLQELAELQIHSIEQPIKAGNTGEMAKLCTETPTPIALDEELIGIVKSEEKQILLEKIKPQYIILKPSLVGGISGCDEWIAIAEKLNIGWWITSALESNIGLNAIAQYTYTKKNPMPQGLGTGALFTNNFETSLYLVGDLLKKKD